MNSTDPFGYAMEIMARLRAPDGCPWDREQDLETLKPFLIEEAYEVLEAMGGDDPLVHRDELGDLFFQIVFQSQIRQEEGAFGLPDVAQALCDKLVRRHPHVFDAVEVADREEVRKNWEAI